MFSRKLPRLITSQLDQLRVQNPDDDALLAALNEICERYNVLLTKASDPEQGHSAETEVVVCSEGFV